MRFSRKKRQSAAWLCTVTLLISSVFGNTVWAGQDEDWITKGSHSYHDCLVDEDCMEEMTMLFEDDDFLEENNWTEEEGQREMLKEMLRIYDLFGKDPVEGWDYYADLADVEINEDVASDNNATEDTGKATASDAEEADGSEENGGSSNAGAEKTDDSAAEKNVSDSSANAAETAETVSKATASNAEEADDAENATASNASSQFEALKKEVRGEKPKYQDYYCTQMQDDLGVELLGLEDGTTEETSVELAINADTKFPSLVIEADDEAIVKQFEYYEKNQGKIGIQYLDEDENCVKTDELSFDLTQLNSDGSNKLTDIKNNHKDIKKMLLTFSVTEDALAHHISFDQAAQYDATTGKITLHVEQNRGKTVKFVMPDASTNSFGDKSSVNDADVVLNVLDFALFAEELTKSNHIEGNVAIIKSSTSCQLTLSKNVIEHNPEGFANYHYIESPEQCAGNLYEQGNRPAEFVVGDKAVIGFDNDARWTLETGGNKYTGGKDNIEYIARKSDTRNGGFSIGDGDRGISQVLDEIAKFKWEDTSGVSVTKDTHGLLVDCGSRPLTVVTVDANDLKKDRFIIDNLAKDKMLVINVDTSRLDGNKVEIHTSTETRGDQNILGQWSNYSGNIIWNFGQFDGKVETTEVSNGLILAANADVYLGKGD